MANLSNIETELIRKMQEELPLVTRPYKQIADEIGVSEEIIIDTLKSLTERKILRRIGAVLQHRTVGFQANAMVAWLITEDKMNDIVKHMIELTQISHCYERLPQDNWPYNIYTMIHCETYEECERIIKELASIHSIERYEVLYSVRELKKSSMKFFME